VPLSWSFAVSACRRVPRRHPRSRSIR